jgi:hypothetical protein
MTKRKNRERKVVKRKNRGREAAKVKSNRNIMIAGAAVIFFAVYWFMAGNTGGSSGKYPSLVKGDFFTGHELTADGTSVAIPADYLDEKKLVYLDVKLEQPTPELLYLGRRIPLSMYKGGEYLPLVLISTPQGKTLSGVRVCEPCGSFNFHIADRKHLVCDACGTRWDIETLQGVSGGCQNYPPPPLTVETIGQEASISLLDLKNAGLNPSES